MCLSPNWKGKNKVNSENIKINNLNIQEVKEAESYKHLGINENISSDGKTKKERVLTEYFKEFAKFGPVNSLGIINSYLIMHLQSCIDTNFWTARLDNRWNW